MSAAIVPSMADMVSEGKKSGMADSIGTEAIIGGYFNSMGELISLFVRKFNF